MNKKIGIICAIFTVLIWGTTFVVTKNLLDVLKPIEILLFRFVISFIALFLFYPKIFKFTNLKIEGLFALAGLSGIAIYQYMENVALTYTSASNVSIMGSLIPFFTALFSYFILKDKSMNVRFIVGFIICLIGIVLVTFNGKINLQLNPLGDLISFGSMILWGLYSVITKIISKHNYNMIQVTRRITMYGVIFSIPLFIINKGELDFYWINDSKVLLSILFLGLIASALCFTTWNVAVQILGALKTSIYTYAIPVVTIVFAALFINEKITLVGILGTLITIVGLIISNNSSKIKNV